MNRRRFLHATGIAALGGIAGCGTDASDGTPSDADGTGATDPSPPQSGTPGATPATGTGTDTADPTDSPTATDTATRAELRTDYRSRERYGSPGESFAPLDDPETLRTVSGSATASDRGVTESGGIKLAGTDGNNVAIERSFEPTDLSDRDLSVAVRTTTPQDIAFVVRVLDRYGNYAALELRQLSYQPPDVGWFRTCPGVYATSETPPDLERATRVQLIALNASDGDVEVWVDDMRSHPKPEKGYVILSWDDGRRAYYERAAPMQDERDLPGVVTMPPTIENVGRGPFMSREHLVERSGAGDEVVAHGTTGETFNTSSAEALDDMLARKKRWLLANGFEGSDFVVYPGNNFDATSLEVTGRYFLMGGMNQAGDVNTTGVNGFDPLVLPRTIGYDLDISKTVVDRAAAHRNCGILNFHHFDTDNTMNEDAYAKLLDHIVETDGVEAITFSDLWSMRTD